MQAHIYLPATFFGPSASSFMTLASCHLACSLHPCAASICLQDEHPLSQGNSAQSLCHCTLLQAELTKTLNAFNHRRWMARKHGRSPSGLQLWNPTDGFLICDSDCICAARSCLKEHRFPAGCSNQSFPHAAVTEMPGSHT